MPIWRLLLRHWICLAFDFARASAGRSRPARIAMMAMTTSSSMRVKAVVRPDGWRKAFFIVRGNWKQNSISQLDLSGKWFRLEPLAREQARLPACATGPEDIGAGRARPKPGTPDSSRPRRGG